MEKQYCATNLKKLHRPDLSGLQAEKNRTAKHYVNEVDLTKQNVIIVQSHDWNKSVDEILNDLGIKERKNAVVGVSAVCRADAEWLKSVDEQTRMAYWGKCIEYYENMGLKVFSAIVHKDEISDHLELQGVPVVKCDNGYKLNWKQWIYGGGKAGMSKNQTEFAKYAGEPFGLQRGEIRVGTNEVKKALSDLEYQNLKIQEKIEKSEEVLAEKKVKLSQLRATSTPKNKDLSRYNPVLRSKLKKLNSELSLLNNELASLIQSKQNEIGCEIVLD